MTVRDKLHQYTQKIEKLSLKAKIGLGLASFFALLILTTFVVASIPKTIQLSYAGESCVGHLAFFPALQQSRSDDFTVNLENQTALGSVPLFSTRLCVTPKQAPREGSYKASLALLNGWLGVKQLSINVSEAPRINASSIEGKSISTVLPFKVELSSSDTLHTYMVSVDGKTGECGAQGATLSCDVSQLALHSGVSYEVALLRKYKETAALPLAKGSVTTLSPLKVANASLADKATLYDMPKSFSFTFDKPLSSAVAALKTEGGQTVAAATKIDGVNLTVSFAQDLPRKTAFVLALDKVISTEGSTLEQPLKLSFSTSGGPKVANVSVGATGVAQNAQIVLTFDQPLNSQTDTAAVVHLSGVSGTIRKLSDTQVGVQLSNAPLCAAFTLTVDKGIKSGSNNETSGEPWQFTSRTVCGTSSTIGYSVRGRPIVAYFFGNGSNVLLFTGGIHGSERSGQTIMQAWVEYLMQNAYKIPADKRVVVVPNTNPDGIASGSRNNANNVNIDRNFPASNWSSQIDTASGVLPQGGGTAPGSEPETKALLTLTRQLKPRLSIAFHAQGRLVGANQVGDSTAIGSAYARTVGYATMYGTAEDVMGYSITGEYEDWMGEELGVPAILVELPSSNGNYFSSQTTALLQLLAI